MGRERERGSVWREKMLPLSVVDCVPYGQGELQTPASFVDQFLLHFLKEILYIYFLGK